MKIGLVAGKLGSWGAAAYVYDPFTPVTGIGWSDSRMYAGTPAIDQAFDRIREQLGKRARNVARTG